MRLSSRAEYRFLQHTSRCLDGQRWEPSPIPLSPRSRGLTREAAGQGVRRWLEDSLAKACLRFLARSGALRPRRFVVAGRRREGALLDEALWEHVGPLRFSLASFELAVALHDDRYEDLPERIRPPRTLGDRLAYHLLLGPGLGGAGEEYRCLSPLTQLLSGDLVDERTMDLLLAEPGDRLVLRSLGDHLAEGWLERRRELDRLRVLERGEPLRRLGTCLSHWTGALLRAGATDLAEALLRFLDRSLRDHRDPETELSRAAEDAQAFRQVGDQEDWLRDLGGLYAVAPVLEAEAERIQGLSRVEREAEEAVFLDGYQRDGRGVLERCSALHQALTGQLS